MLKNISLIFHIDYMLKSSIFDILHKNIFMEINFAVLTF